MLCSAEAHSSIKSAAAVMDVDVIGAAPDEDGRLRGPAVERALDEHAGAVFAVVATGGTTNFVFNLTLSEAVSQTVTVDYTTADGTATAADLDYTPVVVAGTATFTAGTTATTITRWRRRSASRRPPA